MIFTIVVSALLTYLLLLISIRSGWLKELRGPRGFTGPMGPMGPMGENGKDCQCKQEENAVN